MCDYHDVYLQLDVLFLTDFFEKIRKTCLSYYKLDPAHYYTTPGVSMGCCPSNVKNDSRVNHRCGQLQHD